VLEIWGFGGLGAQNEPLEDDPMLLVDVDDVDDKRRLSNSNVVIRRNVASSTSLPRAPKVENPPSEELLELLRNRKLLPRRVEFLRTAWEGISSSLQRAHVSRSLTGAHGFGKLPLRVAFHHEVFI
jgi:hypothetical protein